MARELAQLLVDEGIVGQADVERALARQREAGGALDTALLELGLVTEERLAPLLARAAGLPLAPPTAYQQADARARRVFPAKVAERHGLAPFSLDGRELALVAAHPVDLGLLDEISFMLSLQLTAHVGVEWRVRSLIQRLYGSPLAPRLARLAEGVGAPSGVEPTAFAAAPAAPAATDPLPGPPPARPLPLQAFVGHEGGEQAEPLAAALAQAAEAFELDWEEGATKAPAAEPPPVADLEGERRLSQPPQPPAPPAAAPGGPEPAEVPPAAPAGPEDRSAPPHWTLDQARQAVASATSRDEVVLVALRYARDFFDFAAAFAVARDAVVGHDALGEEDGLRDVCRTVAFYANEPGVIANALQSRAPYLGPVTPDAPGNVALLDGLGRESPRTSLVYPVVVRDRPVCVLYADNGGAPVSGRRLGDLFLLLSVVGAALERIILARKAQPPSVRPKSQAVFFAPVPLDAQPDETGTWAASEPALRPAPPAPPPAAAPAVEAGEVWRDSHQVDAITDLPADAATPLLAIEEPLRIGLVPEAGFLAAESGTDVTETTVVEGGPQGAEAADAELTFVEDEPAPAEVPGREDAEPAHVAPPAAALAADWSWPRPEPEPSPWAAPEPQEGQAPITLEEPGPAPLEERAGEPSLWPEPQADQQPRPLEPEPDLVPGPGPLEPQVEAEALPTAAEPLVELPAVELAAAEQPVQDLLPAGPPVAERPFEQPATLELPTTDQLAVEPPPVELAAAEQPGPELVAVDLLPAEQPVEEQLIAEPPVVEQPVVVVEPPFVEPQFVESPVVEHPFVELPALDQPAVEQPFVEQPFVEPPAVEQPVAKPPFAEPPFVEPPAVEQPFVEPPFVEPPFVEQPVVEPLFMESPTTEQPFVEPPFEEPSTFLGELAGLPPPPESGIEPVAEPPIEPPAEPLEASSPEDEPAPEPMVSAAPDLPEEQVPFEPSISISVELPARRDSAGGPLVDASTEALAGPDVVPSEPPAEVAAAPTSEEPSLWSFEPSPSLAGADRAAAASPVQQDSDPLPVETPPKQTFPSRPAQEPAAIPAVPRVEGWPVAGAGASLAGALFAAPEPSPPVEPEASVAGPAEAPPQDAAELTLERPLPRPGEGSRGAAGLVEDYLASPRASGERAGLLALLTQRAEEVAPLLCDRLPGPLDVEVGALVRTAVSAQGPVLAAVAALGAAAVKPLVRMLADGAPERRRAAAALLGLTGDPSVLAPLAERCLDADRQVAEAARLGLAAHRLEAGLKGPLEKLRRALLSGLADKSAAAARAIGALRDAESIPLLIQALEGSDAVTAGATADALAAITMQRLGPAPRAWLLWWKQNRGRPRRDWLFAALVSGERELRLQAAAELREAAPSPVNYSADLPEAERQEAARAWGAWFERNGYRV